MTVASEVRQLREKLDEAHECIRQLRDMIAPKRRAPLEWGLSRQQEAMFFLLVDREFCEHDVILEAIKAHPETLGDNLCKVTLCHLRRKLAHLGFRVTTKYGQGLALQDRAAWKLMVATGVYRPVAPQQSRAAA